MTWGHITDFMQTASICVLLWLNMATYDRVLRLEEEIDADR